MCVLASLELFDAAGLDRLLRKQRLLTGYLEYLLHQLLGPKRMHILTPTDLSARGCQLSVVLEGVEARRLEHTLARRGIVVDVRGHITRCAPTPLYNSFDDCWRLVAALDELTPK